MFLHAQPARRRGVGPFLGDTMRLAVGGRTARSNAMAKRSTQGLASVIEERPVEAFEQVDVAE
jgi:hypothetical protein